MTKYTPSKIRALVGFSCLIVATICTIVENKPIKNKNHQANNMDHDPILALPSAEQPYLYLQPPASGPVSYVSGAPSYPIQYYQEPSAQQAPSTGHQGGQQSTEIRQEIQYILKPENQILEPQAEAQSGGGDHKHEYISTSGMDQMFSVQAGGETTAKHEYPGEIIYLGQNGELNKIVSASQELTSEPAKEDGLSSLAGMISDNSGVAATILTEIPARDMPQHVLDKLKRQYGVKVVATREYPGANLVINCDDNNSSQGTSICAKSLAFQTTPGSNAPYSFSTSSNEENKPTDIASEQPNAAGDQSYFIESRTDQEATFNSKNLSLTDENYDTNTRVALETLTNNERQSAKTEVQPDSESGFDVQPAAATEHTESKKHGEKYHVSN